MIFMNEVLLTNDWRKHTTHIYKNQLRSTHPTPLKPISFFFLYGFDAVFDICRRVHRGLGNIRRLSFLNIEIVFVDNFNILSNSGIR